MLNNVWFIACIWMGLALIASLISIRTGVSVALVEILIGLAAGNMAVGFGGGTIQRRTTASRVAIDRVDEFSRPARQRRPHFSRRRGDRSAITQNQLAGEPVDWSVVVRGSIRRGVVLCAVLFWVGAARGANCRHRAFDDVGRGGLCSDDRGRFQR